MIRLNISDIWDSLDNIVTDNKTELVAQIILIIAVLVLLIIMCVVWFLLGGFYKVIINGFLVK